MMKIGVIIWASYFSNMLKSKKQLSDVEIKLHTLKDLEEEAVKQDMLHYLEHEADVALIYVPTIDVWDEIAPFLLQLKEKKPVLCWGSDPSYLIYCSASVSELNMVQQYVSFGGLDNMINLFKYLKHQFKGEETTYELPKEVLWQGIYHEKAEAFATLQDYLEWSREQNLWHDDWSTVGILFHRSLWQGEDTAVINDLISELKKQKLNVIPVFTYGYKKPDLGAESTDVAIENYFFQNGKPIISAAINLLGSQLLKSGLPKEESEKKTEELLQKLGLPVLKGIITSSTAEEWQKSPHGLGSRVVWNVAMPEFDGIIEPLILGTKERLALENGPVLEKSMPINERCAHAARRLSRWVRLREKNIEERKIVFVLHNNPCSGLEASVGGGANLDTIESVAYIMKNMQEAGYSISNLPQNGKELIDTIMSKKAIGDFRWTPIEEIIEKKGAMALLDKEVYRKWLDEKVSPAVQEKINNTWGTLPGEAMVKDGKLVITGVEYGNVLVVTQPKRGCLGAKCDGEACKILHDPDCPPTHHYLASYWYWDKVWGADAIVHVGTHGNLEFLPGKSVGLSGDCFPDLAIGDLPNLYIYSMDNPPEGTIAKRRSYAVLVDHLIPVMVNSGTYDELKDLENHLAEYGVAKDNDPAKAHSLEHVIVEAVIAANLHKELKLSSDMLEAHEYGTKSFDELVKEIHEVITRLRDTYIVDGMHIFGQIPEGEELVNFVISMMKYDFEEKTSLRRLILDLLGLDYDKVRDFPGEYVSKYQKTNGELLEESYNLSKELIRLFLNGESDSEQCAREVLGERLSDISRIKDMQGMKEQAQKISCLVNECKREMVSLFAGFNGQFIPAGPSGCPTRGRLDTLPTGKNFYSMDPYTIPSKAAWRVGRVLATRLIEKYEADTGELPENCGMVLFCTDIMWTNGEQVSQILYLLGTEPIWSANGRIKDLRVIPLEELKRPRIDVTLRIGSIVRDCFPMTVDLIDKAIKLTSELDEPEEMNYIRKHTLANYRNLLEENKADEAKLWRQATARIFGSKPGTYGSGVNLAVYASAWKNEQDLAEVYIYWSGYAYGEEMYGTEAQDQFINQLQTMNMTFKNNATDEHDLFGCCCHFSYQGGLTAAANAVSGRKVKTYHGDTRDPSKPEVLDLADEIRRVVRTRILNPKWIDGMKRHGYRGASNIAKRIGRIYGWEATTQEIDDWIFDDIASTYVLDEENRKFFEENNPWALEEIGRRLLEANQRELWSADPEILEQLKEQYLEIEGWLEERIGDTSGEFQGGSVDIMNMDDVADWSEKMKSVRDKLHKRKN